MIQIENLVKSYSKGKKAVDGVSMFCGRGVTGIVGRNGAGKSTLLKSAAALHFADSGRVLAGDSDGNLYDAAKNPELVKKCTGFVPETNMLPKKLTVLEVLSENLSLRDVPRSERSVNLEYAVENCHLEDVLNQKIGTLSRGYAQRLMLACAIVFRPENLVLDEAASGLDPSQIIQFRSVVKDYAKDHSVVVSSHIMHEISAMCEKIYVVEEGRVVAEGSEGDLLRLSGRKSLEDAFLCLTEKKSGGRA